MTTKPLNVNYQKLTVKLFLAFILLTAFALISNFTHAQNIEQSIKITNLDKLNSDAFKVKVGTNRIVEYKKLEHLIIPKSANTLSAPIGEHFIGEYAMSEAELIFLLGPPDLKVSNVIYQYNLGTNGAACKVFVGIDGDGFISYSVTKSCN
ncbi:MAG: hypothetical protein ACEQSR_04210 [Candidatus Methylacidiphilales bacterium]